MKKVLIYGGAGFIGSALAGFLCKKNIQVIIVEQKGVNKKKEFKRIQELNLKYFECNLEDCEQLTQIIEDRDIDVFFQFAWIGLNRQDLENPYVQITNMKCIVNLLETAAKLGCKRFIGAGSFSEKELYIKEGRNYTKDKHKYYRTIQLSCDLIGRIKAEELGIDFFWPQIINVYGPNEYSARLINTFIRKALNNEEMILSEGEQVYDFVYIDDAVNAFYLIGERGIKGEEYVIGSGKPQKLITYLKKVNEIVNPSYKAQFGSIHFDGICFTENDYDIEALEQLGFCSGVTFEEGIKKTKEWIVENEY